MNKAIRIVLLLCLVLTALAVAPIQAQDDDVITIGTNAEYPPFESVDEDGEIVGFDIDLFKALAADAGIEIEFVNTRWDGIFVALSEGEFDAVISAATINDEREEIIDFTDPYFNAGQTIAVRADLAAEVSGPEDLAGLRIGVQLGTTGDEYASEIDGAEVVRFDEITLAFQAIGAGDLDAIINDGPTSADIIANNPDLGVVIVGDPLTDEFYGIAVNPELSDLLDTLNTSLANIIADGTYAAVYEEWFGVLPPSAFLPAEAFEADLSTPEGALEALLHAFFGAIAAQDPAGILELACEGAGDSPLIPSAEGLAAFSGLELIDINELTIEVTENEDGSTSVVPGGSLKLLLGGAEQPIPAALLMTQLGIESIRFEQSEEDGNWYLCPGAAE